MKYHFLMIVLALLGCSKTVETYEESDCLDKLLKEHNMVPYTGNENYYHSLQMVKCENNIYYFMDCCICDMAFNPFDCNIISLLLDAKTGEYSPEKQKIFDATFKKCSEPLIVGVYK